MNRALLRAYIQAYKAEFSRIHNREIYKWRAVKKFQDAWNINARDFDAMLDLAISETHNLMAAANYWPRRMIESYATKRPETVRGLFAELFNEEADLLERIAAFQISIATLNAELHPDKNTYQDHRAVLVYLNLKYPDSYFLYKYRMFKVFCEKIEYDYKPRLRATSANVLQFLNLCTLVRDELLADNELLKLHKNRIKESEYFDTSGNILTQDFIYAVSFHLKLTSEPLPAVEPGLTFRDNKLQVSRKHYQFKGGFVDHVSVHRRNKRIGDLGEQIVLDYERRNCPSRFMNRVVHSAKSEGDGLGFDILSTDRDGNEKYIEVKTTKGGANTAFYISGAEVERSKKEGERYFLYRLYNLDEKNMTADFFIIRGDLSNYCINPTEYEVILKT